jgi:hypothetical protein
MSQPGDLNASFAWYRRYEWASLLAVAAEADKLGKQSCQDTSSKYLI